MTRVTFREWMQNGRQQYRRSRSERRRKPALTIVSLRKDQGATKRLKTRIYASHHPPTFGIAAK
jgi:hypothetical protein